MQIVVGVEDLKSAFNQMKADFGPVRTSKGLVTAVRRSIKPALTQAKSLVPVDTGALRALLRAEARVPNKKDKRSQYVQENDVVIALITTPPARKLDDKTPKGFKVKIAGSTTFVKSDARAIAQEFGTAKHPAKPYLRPAMESQQNTILTLMAKELFYVLEKYRAKQAKGV